MPYNQTPHTDKLGNEWNVEQNGMLNRPNSGNSIIGGCASLMIGNQQFYCNQPMASPDGRDLVMTGAQPLGGMNVTRRLRFLDKEGGIRFVEQFTNTVGRDATITVEIRHNFNGGNRTFLSDRARALAGRLEENQSGAVVLPGQGNNGSPSLLLTVSTPRNVDKPRVSGRNQYQLSFFHTLTVPAGKTASIIHTIGQAKTSLTPDEEELQKLFRPLSLSRSAKDLPRDVAATLANLKSAQAGEGLESWFPTERWGIKPETFDVLAIGDATRLKGTTQCAKLTIKNSLGEVAVPWDEVAALAGSRFAGKSRGCIWLKNGEMLTGQIEALELRFTLVSGLGMDSKIADLDRLVVANAATETKWPDGIAALIETQTGDRIALNEAAATLPMATAWGDWPLELKELIALTPPEDGAVSGLARFRDGSRVRLLPSGDQVTLATKRFGSRPMALADIRQIVTAEAAKPSADPDEDPAQSFVDLTGDQRLIARITADKLRLATSGGLVELTPASIRDLRDVTEEQETRGNIDGRIYQAELWGGGTVIGPCADATVRIEGKGFAWTVPMRHVTRIGNPVPTIESAVMARIGTLIRELGDEKWKTREAASTQLKELGPLARPSLQEAAKRSTDAEVTRRIEVLLQGGE